MEDKFRFKQIIIQAIFNSKELSTFLKRLEPDHLREELKSELMLMLCEMDEGRLIGMYERGEIMKYIYKTGWNSVKSNTSNFYRKFRGKRIEYTEAWNELDEISYTEFNYEDAITKILQHVESLTMYECELIKLYMEYGSYRNISKATKIPLTSIYDTIKACFQKIKNEYINTIVH